MFKRSYQCDCGEDHFVVVESLYDNTLISLFPGPKWGIKHRIKTAFNILLGRSENCELGEIILTQEDVQDILKIMQQEKERLNNGR